MNFIRLPHAESGDPVWVRADHVTAVTRQDVGDGRLVTIVITPAQSIATAATVKWVTQSIEQILRKQDAVD